MNYWLLKTEPSAYSWDDLKREKTTGWDGVRNYQARNIMRDQMQKGDLAFFYHSRVKPMEIMGVVRITKTALPDDTALDTKSKHFDPKHTLEKPIWYMVEVKPVQEFTPPITRDELKEPKLTKALAQMVLLQKGSRLSVQPVTKNEWDAILNLRK